MPPLEALKSLWSLMCTRKRSRRGGQLKMAFWDVSHAHLYGTTQRELFTELPEELAREGHCARLLRSLYGTQDASSRWQREYTGLFAEHGWKPGVSNPAVFYCEESDGRGLCHGDDICVLADQETIDKFDAVLRSRYDIKKIANVGPTHTDDREVVMLNRTIRCNEGSD